jgi:hypothetical protein
MSSSKITLLADFINGEGSIGNIENWRKNNYPILRADLLKDWIALLQDEYNLAINDLRKGSNNE